MFRISVRSVYVKIIKYSGSILANLNNTTANKTACNEKTTRIFKYKQDNFFILGTIFCGGRILAENVQN